MKHPAPKPINTGFAQGRAYPVHQRKPRRYWEGGGCPPARQKERQMTYDQMIAEYRREIRAAGGVPVEPRARRTEGEQYRMLLADKLHDQWYRLGCDTRHRPL